MSPENPQGHGQHGGEPEASHRAGTARVIHVVLPAYNEASNIGAVLKALEQAGGHMAMSLHAIVVNDGSRDATGQVVRDYAGPLPVTLMEHPSNLGLGAAIRSGLFRAVDDARAEDIIVTMDSDDTHTPVVIAQMVAKIDAGLDVLIASRYQPGATVVGVPALRRFLSHAASILFRAVFPTPGIRDFTCGYRGYRASVLKAAISRYRQEFINQEGFQCMVDILLKLRPMRLRFGEVPLTLRYDRKGGKSKMKVARTVVKTLALLVKRRLGF